MTVCSVSWLICEEQNAIDLHLNHREKGGTTQSSCSLFKSPSIVLAVIVFLITIRRIYASLEEEDLWEGVDELCSSSKGANFGGYILLSSSHIVSKP
eukprot:c14709_g1_i2 orf=22-312(+)